MFKSFSFTDAVFRTTGQSKFAELLQNNNLLKLPLEGERQRFFRSGHETKPLVGFNTPFTFHPSLLTSSKSAFTLAEVLITLGIIGVVAAMTLPALTKKYQDKIMLTQVKRAYSDINNALTLYAAENSCSDITCISDTSGTSEELIQRIYKSFKGATYCSKTTTDNGICKYTLVKGYTPTNNGYGQSTYSDSFRAPFIVSASGSAYQAMQYNECPRTVQLNVTDDKGNYVLDDKGDPLKKEAINNVCAVIYFDANGTNKGPNQYGADVFQISILSSSKKLSPQNILSNLLSTEEFTYTPHSVGSEIK